MAGTALEAPIVYQFRYYGVMDDSNNFPQYPATWAKTDSFDLLSGRGSAVKLGIQTLPGVKFYISDNAVSRGIIIDHTGVFELDLRETTTTIGSLYFDPASLARIDEVDNASIIVDVLCNSPEGGIN